jgi:hypothetical protein
VWPWIKTEAGLLAGPSRGTARRHGLPMASSQDQRLRDPSLELRLDFGRAAIVKIDAGKWCLFVSFLLLGRTRQNLRRT